MPASASCPLVEPTAGECLQGRLVVGCAGDLGPWWDRVRPVRLDVMPDRQWDREVDVVVVGTGAAGSTAAVEAAERGMQVLALDRWGRGGASARSGGVIYSGGGTAQQVSAGFADDPDEMEQYLALEEGVAADDPLLRQFCERSRADLEWLAAHGATVPNGFDPAKAIVPTDDDTGLYFSGNEKHFAPAVSSIPRGHRIAGVGMTGYALVDALHDAARAAGVEMLDGARLTRLIPDRTGGVAGVEVLVLERDLVTRFGHVTLFRLVNAAGQLLRRVPHRLAALADRFETARGRRVRIRARAGVILATGGFSFNHELLAKYAPAYERTMPLGTAGDDGSGILAATALGASLRLMDRCGASRFYSPPVAFSRGVLVDDHAERVCDESLYAATLSTRIAAHGGRAWLVLDRPTRDEAWAEILSSPTLRGRHTLDVVRGRLNHVLFPWMFGPVNLTLNAVRGATVTELARRCGLPPDRLEATLAAYNEMAQRRGPDPLGKPTELVRPLGTPPFLAVRCDLDSLLFPAPCITLGGLDVDEHQCVKRTDGSIIPGLHAVGRCAAGVASRSYVSGLSLADCIFSGRNAGLAVTTVESGKIASPR
ncbi:MAG: FAD-binding protein [Acidimicrobiia bacterium]